MFVYRYLYISIRRETQQRWIFWWTFFSIRHLKKKHQTMQLHYIIYQVFQLHPAIPTSAYYCSDTCILLVRHLHPAIPTRPSQPQPYHPKFRPTWPGVISNVSLPPSAWMTSWTRRGITVNCRLKICGLKIFPFFVNRISHLLFSYAIEDDVVY